MLSFREVIAPLHEAMTPGINNNINNNNNNDKHILAYNNVYKGYLQLASAVIQADFDV